MSFMELELPKAPNYKNATAEADRLTAAYSTPPIPALEIAEASGVNVVFTSMGVHSEKVAGFCDFESARLYVNSADPTNRQTFTIAHELGHWILHRKFFLAHPDKYPVLPRFQAVAESNVFEKEANCFAANLLVPSRLLRPIKDASVTVLARIFLVSIAMMENRLKNV
ncbi:ImmA/IrrE family metallo-endopeptidase [Labrys sp. KB_33_2]|uniref:ImmA/IrrE family metallo-endopeptidase n=1 Tax=Labrys sp. KB_33_2 TaxID=3237479 RepID=UPI003F9058AC